MLAGTWQPHPSYAFGSKTSRLHLPEDVGSTHTCFLCFFCFFLPSFLFSLSLVIIFPTSIPLLLSLVFFLCPFLLHSLPLILLLYSSYLLLFYCISLHFIFANILSLCILLPCFSLVFQPPSFLISSGLFLWFSLLSAFIPADKPTSPGLQSLPHSSVCTQISTTGT